MTTPVASLPDRLAMHARDCVKAADMDTDVVLSREQIDAMADDMAEAALALASPAPSAGVVDALVSELWSVTQRREYATPGERKRAIRTAITTILSNYNALQHPAAPSVSPAVEGDCDLLKLADEMQRQHDDGRAPWIHPNDIAMIRRLATPEQPAINPSQCPKCKAWPIDADACGYCGNPKPFIQELQK